MVALFVFFTMLFLVSLVVTIGFGIKKGSEFGSHLAKKIDGADKPPSLDGAMDEPQFSSVLNGSKHLVVSGIVASVSFVLMILFGILSAVI